MNQFKKYIEKFTSITTWIENDIKNCIDAKANFVVAMSLFNYTEFIGSFIKAFEYSKKGKKVKSECYKRFNSFFKELSLNNKNLLLKYWGKNKSKIYDDLRCGLTHEYLVKRVAFTILNNPSISNEKVCNLDGVEYIFRNKQLSKIIVRNNEYLKNWTKAVNKYILLLKTRKDRQLEEQFLYRSRRINFKNFQ